ncbi:MAG: hypothetical protein OXB99_07830 [Acidimicrobiaceae bacterium]|nr:hypothetical protein [Acidimicrobiaceae bacterium]
MDDSIVVTVTVTNVDELGTVTFDSDAPAVGTALTASLEDPDGRVSGETWVLGGGRGGRRWELR